MATRLKLRDRCQCLTILGLNVRLDYKVWKHIHVEYLELSLIHFTADPFSPLYLSCCMLIIKSSSFVFDRRWADSSKNKSDKPKKKVIFQNHEIPDPLGVGVA